MGPNNCQATYQVRIITPTDIIRPTSSERLLGCYIRKDIPWAEYIKLNKESLMKSLHLRLGAVKKIRYLWGGCDIDLKKSLPALKNKAAQAVT